MAGDERQGERQGAISLLELLSSNEKTFEIILKHYSEQFSYHAAQRLTTFRYFITAYSIFSAAYATLLTSDDARLHLAGLGIAFFSYLLVLCFGRLDRRNEQIILINEEPIKRAQRDIDVYVQGGGAFSTFDRTDKEARTLMTFGSLLPLVFLLTSALAIAGMYIASEMPGALTRKPIPWVWVGIGVFAFIALYLPTGRGGAIASARAQRSRAKGLATTPPPSSARQ